MTDVLERAPSAGADGSLFVGGGRMGAMMGGHDWSASPLGPPATWPQPLKTLIGVMLNSSQPMFVAWGPGRVLLYNDPYAQVLADKHPDALGRDFLDVWHEIRGDLRGIVEAAYSGRAVHMDDIALTMERKGYPEETHFAFSYTPVRDESGAVAGFFCPCNEITRQVVAERRQTFQSALDERLGDLDDLEAIVVAASELLARELGVAHAGYARVEDDQRHVIVKGEWGDSRVASLKGRHDLDDYGPALHADLRRGVPILVSDIGTDERTNAPKALEVYRRIGVAAFINMPLVRNGKLVANALVHSAEPRAWSDVDLDLVRDMAERVWSALERVRAQGVARDTDKRYRVAALATNDAIWDWDLQTNSVLWNEALFTAHRFTRDQVEFTGDWWISRIHPDDRERVDHSIHEAIAGAGEHWTEEYRFRRGDDTYADVLDRGYVIRDGQGAPLRVIGAMLDLTESNRAKEALRAEEERLRFALDAGGLGAWELDLRTFELTTSAHCRENFGRKADQPFTYDELRDTIHPDDRERQEAAVRAAVEGGQDYAIDYRVNWPDGQVRWINVRGRPVYDGDGAPLRMAGVSADVTHRTVADMHQRLLIDELNHRVKNTLATIQSIAMQTFRVEDGAGAPPEQRELFESRIIALSKVHDVLTRENWEGARLRDVVLEAVAAHSGGERNAFTVQGPDARLSPKTALSLSMALHELCTNAAKYGALSVPDGRVSIRWTVETNDEGRCLRLRWREEGGPSVTAPARKGFGSRLIERQLARELRGKVELAYASEGVSCIIEAPLSVPGIGPNPLLAPPSIQ